MKILLVLILALGLNIQAQAGEDRGGGGGFCVNSKCVTIGEAGFRIGIPDSNQPGMLIPASTMVEVQKIIKGMVIRNKKLESKLVGFVVGDDRIFSKVESYNSQEFSKYREEYLNLLKASGMNTDNFELLAVSEYGKTYLLPDFYRSNSRTQALILIHEANIRVGVPLKIALYIDGKILDYLSGKITGQEAVLAWYSQIQDNITYPYLDTNDYQKLDLGMYLDYLESKGQFVYLDKVNGSNPEEINVKDNLSSSKIYENYPELWQLMKLQDSHYLLGLDYNTNSPSWDKGRSFAQSKAILDLRCKKLPQGTEVLIYETVDYVDYNSTFKDFLNEKNLMPIVVKCLNGKVSFYTEFVN